MSNDIKKLIFAIVGFTIIAKFLKAMDKSNVSITNLIKQFEGVSLKAYRDIAGVWTIGHGLTTYPNGKKVQPGDTITQQEADQYFQQTLQRFAQGVEDSVQSKVNNNQFAALVSFAYNVGLGAFRKSTLLKMVNANPNDPDIRRQFMRWIYAGGKPVQGLVNRRTAEANLYFT